MSLTTKTCRFQIKNDIHRIAQYLSVRNIASISYHSAIIIIGIVVDGCNVILNLVHLSHERTNFSHVCNAVVVLDIGSENVSSCEF